jgi:hypothetical protein
MPLINERVKEQSRTVLTALEQPFDKSTPLTACIVHTQQKRLPRDLHLLEK